MAGKYGGVPIEPALKKVTGIIWEAVKLLPQILSLTGVFVGDRLFFNNRKGEFVKAAVPVVKEALPKNRASMID